MSYINIILVVLCVMSSLGIIFFRDPIKVVASFVVTSFGISIVYIQLETYLLAVTQVLPIVAMSATYLLYTIKFIKVPVGRDVRKKENIYILLGMALCILVFVTTVGYVFLGTKNSVQNILLKSSGLENTSIVLTGEYGPQMILVSLVLLSSVIVGIVALRADKDEK